MRSKMFDQARATLDTLMKEFDFGMDESTSPEIWVTKISEAASNLKELYGDESKPLIHYEFLYKSVIKSTIAYFKHIVSKFETFDELNDKILKNENMMKELKFYLLAEKCVKEMQNLDSTDRVKVKMEIAKVYRWFEKR